MTVQDFIVNYSATFEYLHKRYGKAAVVALWEYLGETNTELYDMVAKDGLEGYLRYFYGDTGTCFRENVEGGAWIDEQDNGDGTKTLAMQLSGAREISFALRAKGAMRQTTVDGVLVTALAQNAGITLHIRQLAGRNSHHIIEGAFKAAARALRAAAAIDPALGGEVPSTKGIL